MFLYKCKQSNRNMTIRSRKVMVQEVIFGKYAHLTISRNKIKFTSKNYLIIALYCTKTFKNIL